MSESNGQVRDRVAGGVKAAARTKNLVALGELYEKEHGIMPGRMRQRQLVQYGKLYEYEQGVRTKKPRPRRDKAWKDFVAALSHVVRPCYRKRMCEIAETLCSET
jgi:hypothetical protein